MRGCRRATLRVAHATKCQTISISFAGTKIPTLDPIVSRITFTHVMLTEVPPIVAIRTLATAVAQSRAEVVAQICSLLSIIYRKQAHFLGTNLLKIARGSENLFKLYAVTGTLWSVLQYNKHLYVQR